MLAEYLLIGEILKPQGVQGQVKVKPYTDDPERFFNRETNMNPWVCAASGSMRKWPI